MNLGDQFIVVPVPADEPLPEPQTYPIFDPAWVPKKSPKPANDLWKYKDPRVYGFPIIFPAAKAVQAIEWILAL